MEIYSTLDGISNISYHTFNIEHCGVVLILIILFNLITVLILQILFSLNTGNNLS